MREAWKCGLVDVAHETRAAAARDHLDEYSASPDTTRPAAPAAVTTVGRPQGGVDVQVVSFESSQRVGRVAKALVDGTTANEEVTHRPWVVGSIPTRPTGPELG